jgi:cell division protein FtsN
MKPVFQARQAFVLYAVLLLCFAGLYFAGLEFGRGGELSSPERLASSPAVPAGAPAGTPVEVFDDLGQLGENASSGQPEPDHETNAIAGVSEAEGGSSPAARESSPPPSTSTPVRSSRNTRTEVKQAPATKVPAGETRFTIQVAAHSNRQEAEQTLLRLEDKQFVGRIRPPQGAGDTYYRVWVGDYGSREDARVMEEQLKAAGFLTYLRKIE